MPAAAAAEVAEVAEMAEVAEATEAMELAGAVAAMEEAAIAGRAVGAAMRTVVATVAEAMGVDWVAAVRPEGDDVDAEMEAWVARLRE